MTRESISYLSTLRGTDKDSLIRIVMSIEAQLERIIARLDALERKTGDSSADKKYRGF